MEKTKTIKTCPACNRLFECEQSNIKNCFCNSITISEINFQKISSEYKDCLCLNCLKKFETKNTATPFRLPFLIIFFLYIHAAVAQFAGPVGSSNTSAMHKDSSAFVAWATGCTVNRGLQDATTPSLGVTDVGADVNGTLKAGDNPVVSLGDGGYAILTFPSPIKNGTGFDFAVFENAFNDSFLELAFVEVSSDGINFFRFAATSNTQYTAQIGPYDQQGDASKLNNLAGKYRFNYGTPFDLEELKNQPGLDVNAITHVKITDVVGSIAPPYSTYDINNHPVNDPFPTAFGNGGFDLDAVGVIHQNASGVKENAIEQRITVYPNPCSDFVYLMCSNTEGTTNYKLTDAMGTLVKSHSSSAIKTVIDTGELPNGIYFLTLERKEANTVKKIVIRH